MPSHPERVRRHSAVIDSRYLYRGQDIHTLTRDELLAAFRTLADELRREHEWHHRLIDMDLAFRDAEQRIAFPPNRILKPRRDADAVRQPSSDPA